jgi:hypothetical protein
MENLKSTTYLSKTQVKKFFKLTDEQVDDYLYDGKLEKHFSYYHVSEELLRELGVIPSVVVVQPGMFGKLAKQKSFVLREIIDIFDCNRDTAKIFAEKYMYKKYNYYYKTDVLNSLLMEGAEDYEI